MIDLKKSKYCYYYTNNGILLKGDCIKILPKINIKFNLILTDPPYGVIGKMFKWDLINVKRFTNKWWLLINNKINKNGSIYIFWSQKYLKEGLNIFNPDRILIWEHPNLAKPTNKMFLWTYDPIFYIKKGKPTFNSNFSKKENKDIFTYAKPQSNYKKDKGLHPAQKPLELIKLLIKISTNKGDIVLDPFAGTGTTSVACELLNRKWIAIEKEEKYCKIIKNRIEEVI